MTQPPYGNYPPPPAGGFGDYAPVPPAFSVGDALKFGWERFKANPGVWIGITVLFLVITGGISAIGNSSSSYSAFSLLTSLVSVIVGWYLQAAIIRGTLDEVDGRKPGFGNFFALPNVGQILLAGLFVSVMTTVGFVLLIIPGLIVLFLSYLTPQFVVDRQLPAVDAIKASWTLASKNVGPLLVLALAVVGVNLVGALLCGIGLLVTIPVTSMAVTYAYRTLSGSTPWAA